MSESDEPKLPYIGLCIDVPNNSYWVYFINPSSTRRFLSMETLTGAYDDDLVTSTGYRRRGGVKPQYVMLLEQSDLTGLDMVIWYHLDIEEIDKTISQVWFSLPKGWSASMRKFENLDCGIYGMKIPLRLREGDSVAVRARQTNAVGLESLNH